MQTAFKDVVQRFPMNPNTVRQVHLKTLNTNQNVMFRTGDCDYVKGHLLDDEEDALQNNGKGIRAHKPILTSSLNGATVRLSSDSCITPYKSHSMIHQITSNNAPDDKHWKSTFSKSKIMHFLKDHVYGITEISTGFVERHNIRCQRAAPQFSKKIKTTKCTRVIANVIYITRLVLDSAAHEKTEKTKMNEIAWRKEKRFAVCVIPR